MEVASGLIALTLAYLSVLAGASQYQFSFYVAELPREWQTAYDVSLDMQYGVFGLGRMASFMVSEDSGFWITHWTRTYPLILRQLLNSPLRTYNFEEADAVFVSGCLGFCHDSINTPLPRDSLHDIAFFGNASLLLPGLGVKPHFMIYNGVPPAHWYKPIPGWRETMMQQFTLITLQNDGAANVVAAPYPSHEHFSLASRYFHTSALARARRPASAVPRAYHVVTAFQGRLATTDTTRLRHTLLGHCAQRPSHCGSMDWRSADTADQQATAYSTYFRSTFTLHPPGDWLLRGAFYDSIVATCLPVVFLSNYTKYAAFSDVVDYDRFVTYVDPAKLAEGHNVIDILGAIAPPAVAQQRQLAMDNIRHVFQYMLYPQHSLIRFDHRSRRMALDDAFTFTMKALLRNLCVRGAVPPERCRAPSRGAGGTAGGAGGAAGRRT